MYSKGRIAVDWGSCDRYNHHITKGPGYVLHQRFPFFHPPGRGQSTQQQQQPYDIGTPALFFIGLPCVHTRVHLFFR